MEMIHDIYKDQLKLISGVAVKPADREPTAMAVTIGGATRSLINRMYGMIEEFLLRLATNAQEQVFKVHDGLESLSDPDYIDTEISRQLNDTLSEVIDTKLTQVFNKVLPDSADHRLRTRWHTFSMTSCQPSDMATDSRTSTRS